MMPEIKICGLTCKEDIKLVNEFPISYAGFVLYFPKSKRNVTLEQAQQLMAGLNQSIKPVAVTVSPTLEQAQAIQSVGFKAIQIHGDLHKEVEEYVEIPIFRAINVCCKEDIQTAVQCATGSVRYLVFDGKNPGSGETFDWGFLKKYVDKFTNIILAGGLTDKNVSEAIQIVSPAIVDVSSSVEIEGKKGKDRNKVKRFVAAVESSNDSSIK